MGGRGISARSDSDSGIEAGDTNSCDGKIKQVTEMLYQEDHDYKHSDDYDDMELMMMKASDTNSCDGKIKQVRANLS